MRKLTLAGAAVLLLSFTAQVVLAQDNLPPGITIGADGVYQFDPSQWKPGDPVFVQPEGLPSFQAQLPGGETVCAACYIFNTYTGPNGEAIVVPNTYTAVMMAITGESPFGAQPDGYLLSGLLQIPAVLGVFESMGITPEQMMNPAQWSPDPVFWMNLNLQLNGLFAADQIDQGTLFLATGIFSFDPGNCPPVFAGVCSSSIGLTDGQGGPGTGANAFEQTCLKLGDCRPLVADVCPDGRDLTVVVPAPRYQVERFAPGNPVVVGQDPTGRGVDVRVRTTLPPIIVLFNNSLRVPGEQVCTWVGQGQGGGCGNWGGKTNYSAGFQPWMVDDPDWGLVEEEHWICVRETKTYQDKIWLLTVQARLTDESISWIESGDLQGRYPGARVYRALWPLWPGYPPAVNQMAPDGSSFLLQWERLPLRDPGRYRVVVAGQTSGTPYTAPRALSHADYVFEVALFEAALIK